MASVWRSLIVLCVIATIGPAVIAILIITLGKLEGCAPDALSCAPGNLGAALAFTLDWAWHRILDPALLGALTLGGAIGAAYGYQTRGQALVWSLAGAVWPAVAALILPYAAIFWIRPAGCFIGPNLDNDCIVWGHPMAEAFGNAGRAFWLSVFVVPIGLGGLLVTFILASLRRPPGSRIR